ncbi:MAG: PD-(D/E)XK nuclease family protein [Phycisphaeraceae bacterium]|nr:PD-(D/E)XK nuclease family protein [Phycisphaeraceae bacterium]
MSIQRDFLGWDGPFLERAARWLLNHFGATSLGEVTVVTPGSRSGRGLLHHLATQGAGASLAPPQVVTVGRLPELLYEADATLAPADPLLVELVAAEAIRRVSPEARRVLLAKDPDEHDVTRWLATAREWLSIRHELAAANLTAEDVARRCEQELDDRQSPRWRGLAEIDALRRNMLDERGWRDPQDARLEAVARQQCHTAGPVVLCAMLELGEQIKAMLRQLNTPVIALIHAPAGEAEMFDDLGCLREEAWSSRSLSLPRGMLHVVDGPDDQAKQVVACLEELGESEALTTSDVTVAGGDAAMLPTLARAMDLSGVPARMPSRGMATQAPPAEALALIAAWLDGQRTEDLASLLRHPDVERAVRQSLGGICPLTAMDDHVTRSLPGTMPLETGNIADPANIVTRIRAAATALLPPQAAGLKPLHDWAQPMADMLARLYGSHELRRHVEPDETLIHALELFGETLQCLHQLQKAGDLSPRVTLAQAIRLVLASLSGQELPGESDDPAVEVLGWLETYLDESPILIVTGLNEGVLPQATKADPLLPDGKRQQLGLAHDGRRYARDLAMLTTMLHSRRHVRLIAGRRSRDGDPLTPSRLLLAGDDAEVAQVVMRFTDTTPVPAASLQLLHAGDHVRLKLPLPKPPDKPIDDLSVTAFRDYLACPYRFYLKHVLKLRMLNDRATELSGADFGNCAHQVMQDFAGGELVRGEDPERIAAFLDDRLDKLVREKYGKTPRAAIIIQREQLRWRLHSLAHWQARQSREGWRIVTERAETELRARLMVDGQPFDIHGRIDRIDRHDEHGYRILDYKTADTKAVPEKTHRKAGDHGKEWIDLQLPLYRKLAEGIISDGPVTLGYVAIPRKIGEVGLVKADWDADELSQAMSKAEKVIRKIRAGTFWPPREPLEYDDGLGVVCLDTARQRVEIIAATAADGGAS